MLGLGDAMLELFEFTGDDVPEWARRPRDGRLPHLAVQVEDTDAALARVEAAGGRRIWPEVDRFGRARVIYVARPRRQRRRAARQAARRHRRRAAALVPRGDAARWRARRPPTGASIPRPPGAREVRPGPVAAAIPLAWEQISHVNAYVVEGDALTLVDCGTAGHPSCAEALEVAMQRDRPRARRGRPARLHPRALRPHGPRAAGASSAAAPRCGRTRTTRTSTTRSRETDADRRRARAPRPPGGRARAAARALPDRERGARGRARPGRARRTHLTDGVTVSGFDRHRDARPRAEPRLPGPRRRRDRRRPDLPRVRPVARLRLQRGPAGRDAGVARRARRGSARRSRCPATAARSPTWRRRSRRPATASRSAWTPPAARSGPVPRAPTR